MNAKRCTKCGTLSSITGPSYRSFKFLGHIVWEGLSYRCTNCWYEWIEPCADAQVDESKNVDV